MNGQNMLFMWSYMYLNLSVHVICTLDISRVFHKKLDSFGLLYSSDSHFSTYLYFLLMCLFCFLVFFVDECV